MKWNNLKINKCPKCNKDWSLTLKEEKTGAFGLKMLIHDCGFKIYERRYREILQSTISKNIDSERHYRPDDENPD